MKHNFKTGGRQEPQGSAPAHIELPTPAGTLFIDMADAATVVNFGLCATEAHVAHHPQPMGNGRRQGGAPQREELGGRPLPIGCG